MNIQYKTRRGVSGVLARLLFIAAILFIQSKSDGHEIISSRISNFGDVDYVFNIYDTALQSSPLWNDSSLFPPLPPRQAEKAALLEVKKLQPEVKRWKMLGISLEIADHDDLDKPVYWIYVVRLQEHPDIIDGLPSSISVVVLMNGHAVDPVIRKL